MAVEAGVPDAHGRREFSSGLLIAPRLVLASRHGLTARDGSCLPGVEVTAVTGPRGAIRLAGPVPGMVAWLGEDDLDAALIELPEVQTFPDGFAPAGLAWGEPVGTRPVVVTITGMPGFASVSTDRRVEVESARGSVDPGTYVASNRYAVDLAGGWPRGWSDWAGVSGAAVGCADGGYLIGVVAWSDKPLEGRRLTAVPASALLGDQAFRGVLERHLGRVPEVEPVELAPFLSRPNAPGSPGGLLRADLALTGFTGRGEEIDFLERWRDQPPHSRPDVKALLVTGPGGEGKTRLAVEFLARSMREGWAGGLLSSGASPSRVRVASFPGRPLLLVVDYAAAHAPAIGALVQEVVRARPTAPVRLLLLARAAGQWWVDLAAELEDSLPGLEGEVLPLGPLADDRTAVDPAALFTLTARSLAPHLSKFTRRSAGELRDLAAALTLPDQTGRGFEHALSVQMAALVALLQQADPLPEVGEGVEDTLLRHERRYRDTLASRRHLDDLRSIRDRAVAGAALFGARGRSQPDAREAACALVKAALAPDLDDHVAKQRDVATWIGEIYPASDPGPKEQTEYWGTVLPDRLGEFLAIRLLADEVPEPDADPSTGRFTQEGLLESLVGCSDLPGAERALLILSRAAEHDTRPATWVSRLVLASPALAGAAALQVAVYAENPAPLRSALVQLGVEDSDTLRRVVGSVHDALPRFSLKGLETSAGLTRELTVLFRELAALNRDVYLPDLAGSLNNHALRLGEMGRRAEALPVSEEALALHRELVGLNRDAYLPNLGISLSNHAIRLAEVGQRTEAVSMSEEALALRRELATLNRDAYLLDLATSLNNHAELLAETGQRTDALPVSHETVALYRELVALSRDAYLPDLAGSLNNHAIRLGEVGRRAEAVSVSEEALALRRELAAVNRDAYLPDLALSLNNYAVQLMEVGRRAEAVLVSEEAIAFYRELTALNRDVHLQYLAIALSNHAARLGTVGRRAEAVPLSEEALAFNRELTALNRDAYLPDLAMSLNNHAARLGEVGRRAEAVPVSEEALVLCRELVALNRDAYLPDLAVSLLNRAKLLAETGLRTEAVRLSEEAVALRRELAALNRDAYLPDLAMSLDNHAARLGEVGRRAEAVPVSEEAVAFYRELAAINRDAYLPDLAATLNNHAALLAQTGQREDAARMSEEAIAFYRELADVNRDAYLPGLAGSLNNHAALLAQTGLSADAVRVSEEAVALCRVLVTVSRDAYLTDLAGSLSNHAIRLAGIGRRADAALVSEEAVAAYRELVALNRDAYLPNLTTSLGVLGWTLLVSDRIEGSVTACVEAVHLGAGLPEHLKNGVQLAITTLTDAYSRAPDQAEATFRRLTGGSLPDSLK